MKQISSSWLKWCKEYKKASYSQTVKTTHELFEKGLSLKQIANKREVKLETIERQIIILIVKGLINIDDILQKQTKKEILKTIEKTKFSKISNIKETTSKEISYFEIKCVLASLGVVAK